MSSLKWIQMPKTEFHKQMYYLKYLISIMDKMMTIIRMAKRYRNQSWWLTWWEDNYRIDYKVKLQQLMQLSESQRIKMSIKLVMLNKSLRHYRTFLTVIDQKIIKLWQVTSLELLKSKVRKESHNIPRKIQIHLTLCTLSTQVNLIIHANRSVNHLTRKLRTNNYGSSNKLQRRNISIKPKLILGQSNS